MATRLTKARSGADSLAAAILRRQLAEQALEKTRRFEMLGRVYDGIAHDLNNLLGVISNSAHLLQQTATEPSAQAALAACLRSVGRAHRLTGQLDCLSNVSEHAATGIVEPAQLLESLQDLMLALLGQRIRLKLRVAADAHPVAVARDEFELALLALLLNARDALPRGGQVWIEVRNADRADVEAFGGAGLDSMVLISVSDDGAGMPDGVAKRAFESYVTTRAADGAPGLGLSRVKAFCDAVGGSASLAFTAGLGTSVTLLLPAATATGTTFDQVSHQESPAPDGSGLAGAAPPALDGVRLLLVEDNKELAAVTTALLSTYGLQVRHAHNAQLALSMLAEQTDIDLVLSDIVMPGGIDGVELAHRIRRLRPRLPVVLITAYSTALGQAGDFIVLRKPCSAKRLIATLLQQLRQASAD